jgi:hypothetical protein
MAKPKKVINAPKKMNGTFFFSRLDCEWIEACRNASDFLVVASEGGAPQVSQEPSIHSCVFIAQSL